MCRQALLHRTLELKMPFARTLTEGNDTYYWWEVNEVQDFVGSQAGAYIAALGGNDWVEGDADGDDIWGGEGNDYLFGAPPSLQGVGGEDDVYIDQLHGENGNDVLYGYDGPDQLDGGADIDF